SAPRAREGWEATETTRRVVYERTNCNTRAFCVQAPSWDRMALTQAMARAPTYPLYRRANLFRRALARRRRGARAGDRLDPAPEQIGQSFATWARAGQCSRPK